MYTLGEYIGIGCTSAFFRIKEHPNLGVKIKINKDSSNDLELLNYELEKAKQLMALDLPIPKYIDIVQVIVPEYYEKTILKIAKNKDDRQAWVNNINNKIKTKKDENNSIYGLLMDYIESDLSLISPSRIKYFYDKERKNIESYGIRLQESRSNWNVLWSQKEAKIYFIDFSNWDLSRLHNPNSNKNITELKAKKGIFSKIYSWLK